MCTKISCNTCARPPWKGCGDHIEEALFDVAVEDRCSCSRGDAPPSAFHSPRPSGQGFGGAGFGSW